MSQLSLLIALTVIVASVVAIGDDDFKPKSKTSVTSKKASEVGRKAAAGKKAAVSNSLTEDRATEQASSKNQTVNRKTSNSEKDSASRKRVPNAKRSKEVRIKNPVSKEQEAAAMALVKSHHDELLELLIHLKESLPSEYHRAIRDLSRTSEKLSLFERRDKTRFQLELALWQAKSHRQLLHARLRMNKSDEIVEQIRETLAKEQQLNLAVLKNERERLANRIEKLDSQITKQQQAGEAAVERQLKTLLQPRKKVERKVNGKTPQSTAKSSNKPT